MNASQEELLKPPIHKQGEDMVDGVLQEKPQRPKSGAPRSRKPRARWRRSSRERSTGTGSQKIPVENTHTHFVFPHIFQNIFIQFSASDRNGNAHFTAL